MIIAIESASNDLSIAVAEADGSPIGADAWSSQRQSAELLPRLLALLEQMGRELRETTAVAVGIGPGSFTGLRVSMSLAKGLAVALSLPVVGVPSLNAWLVSAPRAGAAVARAGANEAYLLVRGEAAPAVVHRESLPDGARRGPVVAPGELAEAFGLAAAEPPTGAARVMAGIAAQRLARDPAGDDLRLLEPAYLLPPRGSVQQIRVAAWR